MCLKTNEGDISAIAAAIAAAQPEVTTAEKNATNPHLKNKYANLTSVMDACRPALARHGLAIVQGIEPADEGVRVTTRLLHASGQWIESSLVMPVAKRDAQGFGSAITYGRRYGLSALIGITPDEDDDANAATGTSKPRTAAAPAQQLRNAPAGLISDAQRTRLFTIARQHHDQQQIKDWLQSVYGIASSKEIPSSKYDEICARLENPAPLAAQEVAA